MGLFSRRKTRRRQGKATDWLRCPGCAEILPAEDVERHLGVCPACGFHHPRPVVSRLAELCDEGSFEEQDRRLHTADLLRFKGKRKYKDRLTEARKQSGSDEALRCGRARLDGRPVVVAVVDADFLEGSLGAVAGERLVRTLARAHDDGCPAVLVVSGGGPRLGDGMLGQAQIARLADGRAALYGASVPLIAVLAPPLPEGGLLSLAVSADVVLAEPGASAEGATADALLDAGLVDRLVTRRELKAEVSALLALLAPA